MAITNMNDFDPSVCAICGIEHDKDESPELDSTHLCPECAAMQSRTTSATLPPLFLTDDYDVGRPGE